MNRRRFLAAALAVPLTFTGCNRKPRVVLYCAQDREFAEPVLSEFMERTGIEVAAKYDTEADKSVSLVEELLREKTRPRCDVFWNNEILGTIRLDRHAALAEYASPSAANYPDWTRKPAYQMFAARARVLLVRRRKADDVSKAPPASLFDLVRPTWRNTVAMARPFFGTTATHAACLFAALGRDSAEQFFVDLKANGVRIVPGNKQSAQAVSHGEVAVGLTDTDDAIVEQDAGYAVDIHYPDRELNPSRPQLGTLFLPNTLALIKNGPNPDTGKRLIDFLLSAEMESRLAANASRQIPLNPEVKAELPSSILRPERVQAMKVDFEKAADSWEHAQRFLRGVFSE